MKVPEEVIEKVSELSIRQVIEESSNSDFNSRGFARSPFRDDPEDTSFSISESKNIFTDWKLRAQGYSGGPIKFIQLYQHLTFVEAVLELAGKYGIMDESELSKYTRKKIERVSTTVKIAPKPQIIERASDEKIDKVYRKIVELSPLTKDDRAFLNSRGFSDKEIDDSQFFTLPTRAIIRKLEAYGFNSEDFAGVPGFYKYEKDDVRYTFNACKGIGLPCIKYNGFMTGLQRRNRDLTPPKGVSRYGWISSSMADGLIGKNGKVFGYAGVGPGTPIDYKKSGNRLCITEGIFKSLALLRENDWDFSVASVQGVGNWRGIDPILNLHSETVIAYDSDLVNNDLVMQQVSLLAEYIHGITGNKVKVMYWKQEYGKGIDDVLFAGNKDRVFEIVYDEWVDIYTSAKQIQASEEISFEEAFNRFF